MRSGSFGTPSATDTTFTLTAAPVLPSMSCEFTLAIEWYGGGTGGTFTLGYGPPATLQ